MSLPFPVEAFPDPLQEYIVATSDALANAPPEYIGVPMLAVAGGVIGTSCLIDVKGGGAWIETPAIWACVVGRPGTKKSPALARVLAPVYAIEDVLAGEHRRAMSEHKKALEVLQSGEEPPARPTRYKVAMSDCTRAAVAAVHAENQRGLLVTRDELVGWVAGMSRYAKGDDRQFWLETWSGGTIAVQRKSGDDIDERIIQRACVAVVGCATPSLLSEFRSDRQHTESGLAARILWSWPESHQPSFWSDAVVPSGVSERWHRTIAGLLGIALPMRRRLSMHASIPDEADWYQHQPPKTFMEPSPTFVQLEPQMRALWL